MRESLHLWQLGEDGRLSLHLVGWREELTVSREAKAYKHGFFKYMLKK
jgi:hypothetical protein